MLRSLLGAVHFGLSFTDCRLPEYVMVMLIGSTINVLDTLLRIGLRACYLNSGFTDTFFKIYTAIFTRTRSTPAAFTYPQNAIPWVLEMASGCRIAHVVRLTPS